MYEFYIYKMNNLIASVNTIASLAFVAKSILAGVNEFLRKEPG